MSLEVYEAAFIEALQQRPDLLQEYEKQSEEARNHWVGLVEKAGATPQQAVQWFEAYLKDAGTGRTPLVGI